MSDDREKQQTREEALAENKQLMEEVLSKLAENEEILDQTIAACEKILDQLDAVKSLNRLIETYPDRFDKSNLYDDLEDLSIKKIGVSENEALKVFEKAKLHKEEIRKRREEAIKEYYQIHGCYPDLKSFGSHILIDAQPDPKFTLQVLTLALRVSNIKK